MSQTTAELAVGQARGKQQARSRLLSWTVILPLLPFLVILVLFARFFFDPNEPNRRPLPAGQQQKQHHEASQSTEWFSSIDSLIYDNGQLHPEGHIHREATTQTLTWRISTGQRRPDGVQKDVFLINDLFPGPIIEARSGDTMNILVHNGLGEDDITMHWHGLEMRDANSMDGSLGVTQCGIQPGQSFWYNFTISNDQSGTFWYHAHSSVQRVDGLYGGLVVHKPAIAVSLDRFGRTSERRDGALADSMKYSYDKELLLLIGDWYHRPAQDVASWYLWWGSMGYEPVPDSMLINGAGRFNCSMSMPGRPVDCIGDASDRPPIKLDGQSSYRIRIVNTGSLSGITVSFAKEAVDIITLDGGIPVEARIGMEGMSSAGILFPGQRMDLVLRPSQRLGANDGPSLITVQLDESDYKIGNPSLQSRQSFPILKSQNHMTGVVPGLLADKELDSQHIDIEKIPSASSVRAILPPKAQQTHMVYTKVEKLSRLANIPHGFFNRTTWKAQSSPPNPLAGLARQQWDKNQLAIVTGSEPVWIDFVVNNLDEGAHPFHLHGHNFYVIAVHESTHGWGSYNPWDEKSRIAAGYISTADSDSYDLNQAVLRDTVQIPRRGYAVLRFRADNPGVWLFHCHVMWHLAGGMAMVVDAMSVDDSTAHNPALSTAECRV
ncbi:multicopper oxidase-domain-containing protein [Talaromyces proteolyticus]|uniref:Multicopper oxidase-domain-containing protein n=1 Tax=Talaromyces proteolyticus TaxID=1131652 RepID=A0AAD4Q1U7_9EURO|nr:multicopper oxidase-domain-containing protein [Talaromyces proteolyticus]KAH8699074.1 multicopper oxidase-domain-containing protein [Talaromyces proteolyticus]